MYGAKRVRMSYSLGNVAIAARPTVGNLQQRVPARELELAAAEIEREGKLAAFPREILVELANIVCEFRREGRFGFM